MREMHYFSKIKLILYVLIFINLQDSCVGKSKAFGGLIHLWSLTVRCIRPPFVMGVPIHLHGSILLPLT